MEEKDIKELWKRGDELNANQYSLEAIERIIQLQPKNIVSKFIKTLKFEKTLNAVAFTLGSIYFLYELEWIWAVAFMIINVLFYVYYTKIIKQLSTESFDTNVAKYLCNVYHAIRRFILHYKILLWIISLPAFIFGIYIQNPEKLNSIEAILSIKIIITLALGFAITIGIGLAILYFMYGKKAKKIKKMIDSLNQEEN